MKDQTQTGLSEAAVVAINAVKAAQDALKLGDKHAQLLTDLQERFMELTKLMGDVFKAADEAYGALEAVQPEKALTILRPYALARRRRGYH